MKKIVLFMLALYSIIPFSWANNSLGYPDNLLLGNKSISKKNIKNSNGYDTGAPAITSLYIDIVISSTVPEGEVIAKDQVMTKQHHGGSQMLVRTIEIGYGSNFIATMNGNTLPISSMVDLLALCHKRNGSGIGPCDRGETIAGYRRTWSIAGHGNGEFTYQVISSSYPNNTKMTKIYIQ